MTVSELGGRATDETEATFRRAQELVLAHVFPAEDSIDWVEVGEEIRRRQARLSLRRMHDVPSTPASLTLLSCSRRALRSSRVVGAPEVAMTGICKRRVACGGLRWWWLED